MDGAQEMEPDGEFRAARAERERQARVPAWTLLVFMLTPVVVMLLTAGLAGVIGYEVLELGDLAVLGLGLGSGLLAAFGAIGGALVLYERRW